MKTLIPTPMENELPINAFELKKGSLVIRAINHKLRQQILKLIHQRDRITVTEIYIKLRLEQSVASQHLAILRKAGFVTTARDGKNIYYSINYERMNEANRLIEELLKF